MGRLPIAQYPDITPPEIKVETTYDGANAVNVEQSVATPLEQKVNGVENMLYMKSTNAGNGQMTLSVAFEVGSDLDISNVLVQNRVSEGSAQLPEDVKRRGVKVKKALAFPLMLVTLRSPNGSYDADFLTNYMSINVLDEIARIQGVGQVTIFGGADYAMRIWIKPDQLSRLALTVPDIVTAVQQQNVLTPAGKLGGPPAAPGTEFAYAVQTRGRLETPEQFGEVVVRSNPDGSQVLLRDVARIELGAETYNQIGRLQRPSRLPCMAVYQLPDANGLEVAENIRAAMQQMKERFPQDIEYVISLDTTKPVSAGIEEIVHTLFEATAIVTLVVFVFLQNLRATLIPTLAVPVALIGTFAVFPLLGFSINTFSLLGLVLAIGIVVDDAIVVVEGVSEKMERGMERRQATVETMKEVSGPVIATALSLTAVFVPVAAMSGHHRPALPAVRDHHRHLGRHLGDRRADAEPGAVEHAAQAPQPRQNRGCWRRFFARLQPGPGQGDRQVHRTHQPLHPPPAARRWPCSACWWWRWCCCFAPCPAASCRRRTRPT